jgi:Ni/Co efflux regulator RcnB
MNRFLLAIALVAVCSAPVLASGKTHSKAKQTHVESTSERQWKSEKAKKRFDRDADKPPPWEPCDYSTTWGPNGCGGS